jgi:hypothetical protein
MASHRPRYYVVTGQSAADLGPFSWDELREQMKSGQLRGDLPVRSGLGTSLGTIRDVLSHQTSSGRLPPADQRRSPLMTARGPSSVPIFVVIGGILLVAAGVLVAWPRRAVAATESPAAAVNLLEIPDVQQGLPTMMAPAKVASPRNATPPSPALVPTPILVTRVSSTPAAPAKFPGVLMEFDGPDSLADQLWIRNLSRDGTLTSLEEGNRRFVRFQVHEGNARVYRRITIPSGTRLRVAYAIRLMDQTSGDQKWKCPRLNFLWTGDTGNVHQGQRNFRTPQGWEEGYFDIPAYGAGSEATLWIGNYECTGTLDIAWVRLVQLP